MTGDGGGYAQATIEIETAEAATGASKAVWTQQYGQINVQVPPGVADGVVVWGQSQAGPVAVTIRIRQGAQPPWGAQPPYPPQQPGYPVLGTPPVTKSPRKGLLIGVGSAVAVVLIAGCCIGARLITKNDDDPKRIAQPPGAATAPVAAPVTPVQYSALLGAADTAIATDFAKLNTGDPAALKAAAPVAAGTLRAQSDRLAAVTPPEAVQSANRDLTDQLRSLADSVDDAAGARSACPAAGGPWPELLRSQDATDLRIAAKDLAAADPTFKFGSFLPAAPKEQNRRLGNGTYLKKPASRGLGHLEIQNGAGDTTISLVPAKGSKPKPVLVVYVRSKGKFTATGVKDGTYLIYSAVGEDWNAAKKGFTRDCGYTKFDDTFKFTTTSRSSTIWKITLTPVSGGNASTSSVDPDEFPKD